MMAVRYNERRWGGLVTINSGLWLYSYFSVKLFLFSVIVSFPLEDDPEVSVIAWTTTPWTLPSNLSLCMHPNLTYVKVKGTSK